MAITCSFVFEVEAQKDKPKIPSKHKTIDIFMMNTESLGLEKSSKTFKSNSQHCQGHH